MNEEYMGLVLLCYGAISAYERYLLDEIDHKELAEKMKDLLDHLPPVTLDGKPRASTEEKSDDG
tara:strand:- start:1593 stop:1784 length:192 start_codon:yes stop_codon:yes gene_type:complete